MLRLLVVCAAVSLPFGLLTGQASAAATPCADLQVASIKISPTNPVQGMPANIAITVHNAGTCAAGGFVTQFRTSLLSPTGPSESLPGLAAGAFATLNLPFVFTSSGNFKTVVEVDTGNAVPETNEANNIEIQPVTVLPPGINLVIDGFSVSPVVPNPTNAVVKGRVAQATITMTNTGNVPAGSFVVSWTPFVLGKPITQVVPGLGPGATTTVTMDFTFPFVGTVKGTAFVDSTNAVKETDEFDNKATLETVVEPPLPNLRVASEGVHEHPAPAGSTSTLDVEVENDGNEASAEFVVTWQPGLFMAAQSQQVSGLPEGGRETVHFSNVFATAGMFDGTVTLDSTNVIPEVNESDNTAPTSFTIPAATVDLTVTEVTIRPEENDRRGPPADFASATVVQGQSNIVTVTVENLGNSPSPSFVTSWNPDAFGLLVPSAQTLTQETGPLGPEESRELTYNFTYPQAGNFRSIADADAFNTVKETNEANNEKILNITVLPAHIDLAFTSPITVSPNPLISNEEGTASVEIANFGPIASGPFAVQLTQQEKGFPKTVFVNGLNVGEHRKLTFPVNYSSPGTFTAKAVVDPFNQVVKLISPLEEVGTIHVVPKSASLRVTLDHIKDIANPAGYQEWKVILFVAEKGASCTFTLEVEILGSKKTFSKTIEGIDCASTGEEFEEEFLNPGDERQVGLTLPAHLQEQAPLIAAAVGLNFNRDVFGIITNVGFPGVAPLISPRTEYLHSFSKTVKGIGCAKEDKSVVNEGHCFDAAFKSTLVSSVGMSAVSTGGAARSIKRGLAAVATVTRKGVAVARKASAGSTPTIRFKAAGTP